MRQTILRLRRELRLTILLSSHLLSEVEQLCTRIAVLKQGRVVFEGSLEQTKCLDRWVRLKVGDFQAAFSTLRNAGLAREARDGRFITLADNVQTDQITRLLVQTGIPVFEIVQEEETLENFYLHLMNGHAAAPPISN